MGKSSKEKGEAGSGRKERLAAELRANLKRRKLRARGAQQSTGEVGKQPD